MSAREHDRVIVIERIVRTFSYLPTSSSLMGDVHVPIYEKFEAELAELRKKADTQALAVLGQRRRISTQTVFDVLEVPHRRRLSQVSAADV
jgi:hypothetical protein